MNEDSADREEHLKYLGMIMDDGYDIVVQNKWPINFSTKMKINFIDAMYEYYKVREYYEKCERLIELKYKIEEDSNDE